MKKSTQWLSRSLFASLLLCACSFGAWAQNPEEEPIVTPKEDEVVLKWTSSDAKLVLPLIEAKISTDGGKTYTELVPQGTIVKKGTKVQFSIDEKRLEKINLALDSWYFLKKVGEEDVTEVELGKKNPLIYTANDAGTLRAEMKFRSYKIASFKCNAGDERDYLNIYMGVGTESPAKIEHYNLFNTKVPKGFKCKFSFIIKKEFRDSYHVSNVVINGKMLKVKENKSEESYDVEEFEPTADLNVYVVLKPNELANPKAHKIELVKSENPAVSIKVIYPTEFKGELKDYDVLLLEAECPEGVVVDRWQKAEKENAEDVTEPEFEDIEGSEGAKRIVIPMIEGATGEKVIIKLFTKQGTTVQEVTLAPAVALQGDRLVVNAQGKVTVYNLQGVALLTSQESVIDFSVMPQGVYIVRVGDKAYKVMK